MASPIGNVLLEGGGLSALELEDKKTALRLEQTPGPVVPFPGGLTANLRVNTRLPFPFAVTASGPMTMTKANGIFAIGFNIASLVPMVALPPMALASQFLLIYDVTSKAFFKLALSALPTGLARTQTIITTTGYNVITGDQDLFVKLTVPPAPVSIAFPLASSRNGVSLRVKDLAGIASNNTIRINLTAPDLIEDGTTTYALTSNFAEREFVPVFAANQWWWSVR